jgi:hypothetical protein
VPKRLAVGSLAVCLTVKPVGKPNAGVEVAATNLSSVLRLPDTRFPRKIRDAQVTALREHRDRVLLPDGGVRRNCILAQDGLRLPAMEAPH